MAVASFCSSRPAPPPAEASAPAPTAAPAPAPVYATPYLYNIANSDSRRFYAARGVASPQPAFELQQPRGSQLLMQCRHCLRFALGFCVKHGGRKPEWRERLIEPVTVVDYRGAPYTYVAGETVGTYLRETDKILGYGYESDYLKCCTNANVAPWPMHRYELTADGNVKEY